MVQASEQPLHRRVAAVLAPPTHTLTHAVAPQTLSEVSAVILTALIRMEHHVLRAASLLISRIQCFYDQTCIGLTRQGPAHSPAAEQIQDDGEVTPATLSLDIGNVAAPSAGMPPAKPLKGWNTSGYDSLPPYILQKHPELMEEIR